ncbi:PLP-dependent aminotransferase family protein [Mesorhizobium sp. YIM 152430]|uniref:MocR-like pyridoxine biosynthesis transcription factor PdxR n=1 Tax=Mesorhizobium sp. YIM 152430 TaxID=3031761 RepID=UPI0023DC5853|nr:PLP-dependent aminotransferase family protein [Mesorhizobium sp. YIM 152430]MDF1598943.1 PLP-dependent aminotransferase family protein [Mesorhizobium sp. YIM 152430]
MSMPRISEDSFQIDKTRPTSLQAQIREAVVSAILSGRLEPLARLPSTRRLAEHLGISRITVSLAYQELAAQGYLDPLPRSGYRICETAPIARLRATQGADAPGALDWSARIVKRFDIARSIRKPLDWRSYPFPFTYGQSDMSLFDLAAWRDCTRRSLSRSDFEFMAGDFAAADDMQLVQYISSRTLPRRGIKAAADEILVTVGAQNAIWIVVQLLLGAGRHAVCEEPSHPDIYASLKLSGASVSTVPVDQNGLPPDDLPPDVDVVFVTPSHQAPTAVRMPMARRRRLLELAQERDFIVVEDDYEFEMSFLEAPSPALRSIDRHNRVLYIGSFSKSLFPGLRLGYLVGPPELIREARALRALMLRHPPGHLQRAVSNFLALGHYDSLIRRMRGEYAKRHDTMAEALEKCGLTIAGRSSFGGTSFWIEGREDLDADALADALRADGVLIESGSPFFAHRTETCRYFRMAYSSIDASRIPEGVERVAARSRWLQEHRAPTKAGREKP